MTRRLLAIFAAAQVLPRPRKYAVTFPHRGRGCAMKPIVIKYHVGDDMYQRRVTLTRAESYGWEIHVEAASQRDDPQTISGLTTAVILAMAEAIKDAGGAR